MFLGVKCGAFSTSNKFTVSPSRCLKSDANVFNDTCKFACASGYLTADPTKMESTCLANRQWSLDEPACIGKNIHECCAFYVAGVESVV